MPADAKAYGHQFPAYRENPIAETLRAVNGLVVDPGFASRYADFVRDMVYGDMPEFEEALSTLAGLAGQLKAGGTADGA